MKLWMKIGIIVIINFTVLFFGLYFYVEYDSRAGLAENHWDNLLEHVGIIDADIYKENAQVESEKIFVTVLEADDNKKYSFKDMNRFIQEDKEEIKMRVFFESDDKNLLNNSIVAREPNAFIEIRGKESEKAPQNSFKIRLFDREGLWHNQNIINLNKYYFDSLRVRNKLAFDYLAIIPNITSFRTRFISLYIKDLTDNTEEKKFESYGLFTQIEQPNKLFLKNHGLDPNGQLYQAENFNFSRYPEHIMIKEDSCYSSEKFEEILEINGSTEHGKLIDMLEAVNDYSKDINEVVDTFFDRENYLTWLAVNIYFDNNKNTLSNFLLYSPLNSKKWYFVPWDFDEAWNLERERPKWQKGLSAYWDNVLHRRFFEDKDNIEALNKKIEELSLIINKKQTQKFLDQYYDILLSNITKLPDIQYLPIVLDNYKSDYKDLANMTERNKFDYYELLENPMPFHLLEPSRNKHNYIFQWEKAYDIQDDRLFYDFELSYDRDFSNIIKQITDIQGLKVEVDNLEDSIYYWRVIAKDEKGNTQIAYGIETDEYGEKYYGIKKLDTDRVKELSEEEFRLQIIEDEDIEETKNQVNDISKPTVKEETDIKDDSKDELKYEFYKVRPGDTLYSISRKIYGNNGMAKTIKTLNGIEDGSILRTGTLLKIPNNSNGYIKQNEEVPSTYKIKQGDTLFSISMKFYGTKEKIEEIKRINNIDDITNISIGTLLKLP